MSEILLQTLVEKITGFQSQVGEIRNAMKSIPDHTDALQQVNNRLDILSKEVKAVPGKVAFPEESVQALKEELVQHTEQLKKPIPTKIEHHIQRATILCIVLFLLTSFLAGLLAYAWRKTDEHLDSDIKFRYVKTLWVGTDSLFRSVDSEYQANPYEMERKVENQEWQRQQDLEARQRAIESQYRLEQLESRDKKKLKRR